MELPRVTFRSDQSTQHDKNNHQYTNIYIGTRGNRNIGHRHSSRSSIHRCHPNILPYHTFSDPIVDTPLSSGVALGQILRKKYNNNLSNRPRRAHLLRRPPPTIISTNPSHDTPPSLPHQFRILFDYPQNNITAIPPQPHPLPIIRRDHHGYLTLTKVGLRKLIRTHKTH